MKKSIKLSPVQLRALKEAARPEGKFAYSYSISTWGRLRLLGFVYNDRSPTNFPIYRATTTAIRFLAEESK